MSLAAQLKKEERYRRGHPIVTLLMHRKEVANVLFSSESLSVANCIHSLIEGGINSQIFM